MTFDARPTRQAFTALPSTALASVVAGCVNAHRPAAP